MNRLDLQNRGTIILFYFVANVEFYLRKRKGYNGENRSAREDRENRRKQLS